jgi:chromate transporter
MIHDDSSPQEQTPVPVRQSLLSLFSVFFRIGLFSFGGGVSGWMHQETVTKRSWIDNNQFLSGLALSQILPGANVSNLAVYIGHCVRGWPGALVALCAVLFGPTIVVMIFAEIYPRLVAIPGFHAAMDGIAVAAVGMIIRMGWISARHSCRSFVPALIAGITFVAVEFFHVQLPLLVVVLAPISIALSWFEGSDHA